MSFYRRLIVLFLFYFVHAANVWAGAGVGTWRDMIDPYERQGGSFDLGSFLIFILFIGIIAISVMVLGGGRTLVICYSVIPGAATIFVGYHEQHYDIISRLTLCLFGLAWGGWGVYLLSKDWKCERQQQYYSSGKYELDIFKELKDDKHDPLLENVHFNQYLSEGIEVGKAIAELFSDEEYEEVMTLYNQMKWIDAEEGFVFATQEIVDGPDVLNDLYWIMRERYDEEPNFNGIPFCEGIIKGIVTSKGKI